MINCPRSLSVLVHWTHLQHLITCYWYQWKDNWSNHKDILIIKTPIKLFIETRTTDPKYRYRSKKHSHLIFFSYLLQGVSQSTYLTGLSKYDTDSSKIVQSILNFAVYVITLFSFKFAVYVTTLFSFKFWFKQFTMYILFVDFCASRLVR